MHKRKLVLAIVLCFIGAGVLCAADFWQKKKYSEWTPQEVQKMMTDSPWAKAVEVSTGGPRSMGSGSNAPGRGGNANKATSEINAIPRTVFLVRFHSALPLKQALMRAQFGENVLKAPEAAQFLSRQEQAYVIGVFGDPRLVPAEPAGLAEAAQLAIKGREPIKAANVEIDRGQGGAGVLFFFPKGQAPIKLEDESFELQVKFPAITIKKTFKLKEMLFDGKLEL